MTFVLKDFTALERHFNDTIEIILIRDKKETVEELDSPRKEQIVFLRNLMLAQKKQIEKKATETETRRATHILYAGMLLVQEDIEANLGRMSFRQNSLLYTRLNDAMGTTDTEKPTSQESALFYQKLNLFFKTIFKENSSRLGLKEDHLFKEIPLDKITPLIKRSYELEETHRKAVVAELTVSGKTVIDSHAFGSVDVSPKLIAKFISWDHLTSALNQLIKIELADKNVADIRLLSKARSTQLHFLSVMERALSSATYLKPAEQIATLAGAMHLVREQIGHEYGKKPLSNDVISNSVIHTQLTKILNPQEESGENKETLENTSALVAYANKFIYFMTVEPVDAAKSIVNESIRERTIFSEINDFPLKALLDLAQEMIKNCRIDALTRVVTEHNAALETARPKAAAAPSFGEYFGKLFASSMKTADKNETEEAQTASSSGLTR